MRKIIYFLAWLLLLPVLAHGAPDETQTASEDRETLSFYLETVPIGIQGLELIYEMAYMDGDYKKATENVASLKQRRGAIYAEMPPAAKRLHLEAQLKKVRSAELAILDGGVPSVTEPKYAWLQRLSTLKARYAAAAADLKVELDSIE